MCYGLVDNILVLLAQKEDSIVGDSQNKLFQVET